jgi:hypothetical protein
MAATVLFSWQADTPTGTGRNFLRKALEDACEAIAFDAAVNEAHRELTVDSDTQGVAGHPPIVETIFNKIDGARMFVADMTSRPAAHVLSLRYACIRPRSLSGDHRRVRRGRAAQQH